MLRNSWKAKRNKMCLLIKKVSDQHSGDDAAWLRDYAKDVITAHKDCLDKAIDCFASLVDPYDRSSPRGATKGFLWHICKSCGYVPPFCYYRRDNICSYQNKDVLHETIARPAICSGDSSAVRVAEEK